MKPILRIFTLIFFISTCLISSAMASIQVSYTLEDLGLGRWKAAYEVQNISLIEPIREFTIWFDYGLYSNLNIETPSPLNTAWNECIYQSYQLPPLTPVNGYYDALSIDSGIAAGQFASGFTITFDWTGDGLPAVQRFEVINPQTFQTVAEGQTTHVPEPACWLLLITGSMYLTKKHRP